jgi:hypothetical protein
MAAFLGLDKLECMVLGKCLEYDPDFFAAPGALAIDFFYPWAFASCLFAASLQKTELYVKLFGVFTSVSFLVNSILRYFIFSQPGLFPGCGSAHEFPSSVAQNIAVTQTLATCYMFRWGLPKTKHRPSQLNRYINVMCAAGAVVIACRIYIGINSRSQLLGGFAFGLFEGIFYHCIIAFLIHPHFSWILSVRLFKFLDLSDSMCNV